MPAMLAYYPRPVRCDVDKLIGEAVRKGETPDLLSEETDRIYLLTDRMYLFVDSFVPNVLPYLDDLTFSALIHFDVVYLFSYGLVTFGPIIPMFVDRAQLIRFQLHKNRETMETYRYEVRTQAMVWMPLLPFVGFNYFSADTEEICQSAFDQFLLDAKRDGYLP